jgi:hypothetical protein
MTIGDNTDVIGAKHRHVATHRQASRPFALATERSPRNTPTIPGRSATNPDSNRKINARSHQLLPATPPKPRNISRPSPLSP